MPISDKSRLYYANNMGIYTQTNIQSTLTNNNKCQYYINCLSAVNTIISNKSLALYAAAMHDVVGICQNEQGQCKTHLGLQFNVLETIVKQQLKHYIQKNNL